MDFGLKFIFSSLTATFMARLLLFKNLDEHMLEVVRGAGIALVLKLVAAGFSFGFSVLLARLFGAEGAGLYFLALTTTTIVATFGRFGLENTLLRFIAAHAANGEWGAVRGVYRKGMGIALATSVMLSVLLFAVTPQIAIRLFNKPELVAPLHWMTLAITPFALMFLHGEALKGLKCIRDSQLVQGVALPAMTCLGLYCIGSRFGVEGAAWVYLAAASIGAICGAFLWRYHIPPLGKDTASFETRHIFDSCIPLLWVQVMILVNNWTAMLSLGVWASKADVGIFGAALRTAMLTSFILASVNSIAAPKFSALFSRGDFSGLATTARKSATMMTAFASPILLVFIGAPGWVMRLFGPEFCSGGLFLGIMAIGQFINVATGSVGYLLIMSGNERLMRNNTIVVGILTIILNLILVPHFGTIGAAVATAISMAMLNLGAFYLVWKKLGIWTIPLFKSR